MSDFDAIGHILAALQRLEHGQAKLEQGQVKLDGDLTRFRTDLMTRMDRLQARTDSLDEHLTLGYGHGDDAMNQARAAGESGRIHAEQLRSLEKLLRMLEARVAQLEGKSS